MDVPAEVEQFGRNNFQWFVAKQEITQNRWLWMDFPNTRLVQLLGQDVVVSFDQMKPAIGEISCKFFQIRPRFIPIAVEQIAQKIYFSGAMVMDEFLDFEKILYM